MKCGKKHKISQSVLLSENAKVGLSISRGDAEEGVDMTLKNILRLLWNAMIDGESMDLDAKSY
jgi:hypothetical protein